MYRHDLSSHLITHSATQSLRAFNPYLPEEETASIRHAINCVICASGGVNISVYEVLNLEFCDERFD